MLANMPVHLAQEYLFQRIKALLPPDVSMVDAVSEVLHLSSDSAYRRIRGETPLVLDEASQLCEHYQLSLDQVLKAQEGTTVFQNVRIDFASFNYEQYLRNMLEDLRSLNNEDHAEIIYLSKDLPFFHNFYYRPLMAFRYFFWMRTMLLNPAFVNMHFNFNCLPPVIEMLSQEVLKEYQQVSSTEICNIENINSTISQIEFYRESGTFSSTADIKLIYEALEETILHIQSQVEYGSKFMPGDNPLMRKSNFKFFYNRTILGDTTILVNSEKGKMAYVNYGVLNYITTRDQSFCNDINNDLQNLKRKATLISQTSEKHRNIFFGVLLSKIEERKRRL